MNYSGAREERLQVAKAQAALLQLGYDIGKVDGKYGSITKAVVKAFQKKQDLKVDGKINAKLLEQLAVAIKSLPPGDSSKPEPAKGQ